MIEIDFFEKSLRFKEDGSGPSSDYSHRNKPSGVSSRPSEPVVYGGLGTEARKAQKKIGKKSKRYRNSNVSWEGVVYRDSDLEDTIPKKRSRHVDECVNDNATDKCDLEKVAKELWRRFSEGEII